ncbi:MAG: ribbon-helix-helix protein, CopG family [Armatimonadota bacterium]
MPDSVARFTISLPPDLLATFDEVCAGKGYVSRSEAVRDAIRDYLVAHDWMADGEAREVVGTLTLVRAAGGRSDALPTGDVEVLSRLQVPLEQHSVLEVTVARGAAPAVGAWADAQISARDVRFGRLVSATSGTELA